MTPSSRKLSPDLIELITRQKKLRLQIVSWNTIAQLAGVSSRQVLKVAAKVKHL